MIDQDPYAILRIQPGASTEDVRQAYLARVREHPPDRDPVRFREIHAAYELLSNPLRQAAALFPSSPRRPDLTSIIAAARQRRSPLPKLALLALGNQDEAST